MATLRQKVAALKTLENMANGNPKTQGEILLESGFSPYASRIPKRVTESRGFKEIIEEALPDEDLTKKHKELLNSSRLDHMTFPLGPKDEADEPEDDEENEDDHRLEAERTTLTDDEIKAMLKEVNCVVRRIVHGQTARHVYFWSHDNIAREKALTLAYKVKGHMKDADTPAADPRTESLVQIINLTQNILKIDDEKSRENRTDESVSEVEIQELLQ